MATDYTISKYDYLVLVATNAKLLDELTEAYMQLGREWNRCSELRELCADIYKRFHGVVFDCWACSSEDFRMYEQRMRALGVEVDDGA